MDRNRTVVVNLDRVRAVITMSEVLVPRPRDPAVTPTSPLPPRRPHCYRTESLCRSSSGRHEDEEEEDPAGATTNRKAPCRQEALQAPRFVRLPFPGNSILYLLPFHLKFLPIRL
jgi:hypothetical protein